MYYCPTYQPFMLDILHTFKGILLEVHYILDLVGGNQTTEWEWNCVDFKVPFKQSHSVILWPCDSSMILLCR